MGISSTQVAADKMDLDPHPAITPLVCSCPNPLSGTEKETSRARLRVPTSNL